MTHGGRTQATIQSKNATGAGFKRGVDLTVKASKDATPVHKDKFTAHKHVREGVWHPGANKP